jgi:hypothetical protein
MSEVSEKQLEANRQNAQLGGVKTEEGKTISKYNAVKHGLLSDKVLFGNENKAELDELKEKIKNDLRPCSEMELLLADRITANFWRLRRTMEVEKKDTLSSSGGLMYQPEKVFRYEIMLERGIYKALHELQRLQASRKGEKAPLPIAVDIDISNEE